MREVWGAGLGLGGALYYNRPANSVFSGGVCIRTMAERVWLGASRGSEVHALQVELELEAGEPSSRVESSLQAAVRALELFGTHEVRRFTSKRPLTFLLLQADGERPGG